MKKCPNCQKTFDDNMKFCQKDGTPLVVVADNEPEVDPYATMVANKGDLPIPPEEPKEEVKEEPKEEEKVESDPYATMVAGSQSVIKDEPKEDDDLLNVLDNKKEEDIDPMKTMVVSGNTSDNIKVDVPEEKPKEESVKEAPKEPVKTDASEAKTILSPDIPKFDEPEISAPANLEDNAPSKPQAPNAEEPKKTPSSPFESDKRDSKPAPIPSPFDNSMPPGTAPPSTPPFEPPKEPLKPKPLNETKEDKAPKSPFAEPTKPQQPPQKDFSEFNKPPSAATPSSGNKDIQKASNFDSPAVNNASPGAEGENKTLAIISLVCGILSMLCCFSIITGPAGLITGYMAKKNIAENPSEYGGATFATVGMITGVLGIILFIILIILQFAGMFAGSF